MISVVHRENLKKNGAKALAAIVDFYGNADVATVFQKAQDITGLIWERWDGWTSEKGHGFAVK